MNVSLLWLLALPLPTEKTLDVGAVSFQAPAESTVALAKFNCKASVSGAEVFL